MSLVVLINSSVGDNIIKGSLPVGSIVPIHPSLNLSDVTKFGYYVEMSSESPVTITYYDGSSDSINNYDLTSNVFLKGGSTVELGGNNTSFQIGPTNVKIHSHVGSSHSAHPYSSTTVVGYTGSITLDGKPHSHAINSTVYNTTTNLPKSTYKIPAWSSQGNTPNSNYSTNFNHTHPNISMGVTTNSQTLTTTSANTSILNTPSYMNVKFLLKIK